MTEEVKSQGGRSGVCFSSTLISFVSFAACTTVCFCCILSFCSASIPQAIYVIFCISIYPLSAAYSYPFYFPSLVASLPLTCSPLSPLRLTHTRTDLTISPIQPPKSNYHGQNRVIKSNGLLYEVHTQKQNKSFSTTIFSLLLTYLLTYCL